MKKIIIFTIVLLSSTLLAGCVEKPSSETSRPSAPKTDIKALVKKAKEVKKEVQMVFSTRRDGNEVTVTISLENPTQKPITSVQSWLSFDPSKIEGKIIDTGISDFDLVAPYDNTFDNEKGLMMLGRGSSTKLFQKKLQVAQLKFELKTDETIFLDAYDYHSDLSGHTSVNSMVDGFPYNILVEPVSPAVVISQ